MASGVGSLYIDLAARTGTFETDMGRAARISERRARQMKRELSQVGRAVATAAALAVTGLGVLVKNTINAQDELSKLSQSVGISTEFLSQLGHAAEISGTNMEEVSKGLARLARNASDAANGLATPKRAFEAIGVSAQNADGSLKGIDELLLEVAESFSGIEDGAAKAALAQELFGRSGVKLIPLLNQGRDGIKALTDEADNLGLTISAKAGRAAEEFNDDLTRLRAASAGVLNQFTSGLLPGLQAIVDVLNDDLSKSLKDSKGDVISWGEVVADIIAFSADAATSAVKVIGGVFTSAGETLGAGLAQGVAVVTGEFEEASRIGDDWAERQKEIFAELGDGSNYSRYRDQLELIRKKSEEVGDASVEASEKVKRSIAFDDGTASAAAEKAADSALSAIAKLSAGLEQQIGTYEKGAVATIQYRIAQGDLAEKFEEAGAAADPYRSKLVTLTEQYESLTAASLAAAEAEKMAADVQAEVARITEATLTPLEQYNAAIERLNELRDTPGSGLDPETYRRAAEAAQDAFESATKEVNAFADQATRNTQDIIARNIRSGFDEGAKGIIKSFGDMISDLVAQALAARLADKLFGEGGAGSGEGWIGQIGTFVGGLFGGARATGGAVSSGLIYRVNEREPEFFRPNSGGDVIPLSKMPASGGVTVNQSINVGGRPDNRTAQQMQIEASRRQRIATARLG